MSVSESWDEQLRRVKMMCEDDGETWDLSDNDKAALRALRARVEQADNEPPPLWRHAISECNAAHHALDKAGIPPTKTVRRVRGPDGYQDITVGLAERIDALRQRVKEAEAQVIPVADRERVLHLAWEGGHGWDDEICRLLRLEP